MKTWNFDQIVMFLADELDKHLGFKYLEAWISQRFHLTPQHSLLVHIGLYLFEFEFEMLSIWLSGRY